MKVTQKTQDWGNSTGIRLPQKVLRAARWSKSQEVSIDVKEGSIILTPLQTSDHRVFELEKMVKAIESSNLHSEVDWGEPTVRELW